MAIGNLQDEANLEQFVRSVLDRQGLSQALAARVAQSGVPQLVVALPTNPADTQEVYYIADAGNNVIWHLRYHAASGKWLVVSGPPLWAEVVTSETTISTTYVALTTAGPSITVPLAGDYMVEVGFDGSSSVAGQWQKMGYDIGGTGAVDADAAQTEGRPSATFSVIRPRRKVGLAAGTALVSKYKVSSGSGTNNFENRWMRVSPLRIG